MITNQAYLAEKMEGRFTLLETQIKTLHENYVKQEASFRSLASGMVNQQYYKGESTITRLQRRIKWFKSLITKLKLG